MKLKPKEKQLKPVPLRLKVPGELHQELGDYVEYYQATCNEPIEWPELAILMIEQFMISDSQFRAWRRGKYGLATKTNGGGDRPSFSSSETEQQSHDRS